MKNTKRFLAVLLAASLFLESMNCGVLADSGAGIISELAYTESAELYDKESALTEDTGTEDAAVENADAEETAAGNIRTEEDGAENEGTGQSVIESGAGVEEENSEIKTTLDLMTDEEETTGFAAEEVTNEAEKTAYTVEASAVKIYTDSMIYINPLYEDVIDESDLVQPSDGVAADTASTTGTVQYFSTVSEAAAAVREAMEARQGTIKIGFTNQTGYSASIFREIFAEAVEHTGVSTQGDYLKWQYAGYHVSAGTKYSSGWYNITYTVTMTYYTTAAQEAEVTSALEEIEASLGLDSLSDYGKVRAIYDYICANVTYDYDNLEDSTYKLKYTAYAALINGTSVCQGYAVLFYRMALDAGVDTRFISGTANGGGHGWNIVKLGDCYYNLDSTWDAPYYALGYSYRYFLLCDANFTGHTRDSAYSTDEFYETYPMGTVDFDPETMDVAEESNGPVITVQPQNVEVTAGDKVTFSVTATGDDLSYQWYFQKSGTSTWSNWYTKASFTAASASSWDGMQLYCVVTDGDGNSVTSDIVTITVTEAVGITLQPQSMTVSSGDTVTFSVEATGCDLSYQWYFKKSGDSTWLKWYTKASFTATSSGSWDGMQVYCVVTDGDGHSVASDIATVTVNTVLEITQQPESVTISSGDKVTFSVEASGSDLSYQWYFKKSGASAWSKWYTKASFTATSASTWDGMQVYCVVTDGNGNSVSSDIATVTFAETLEITEQPQSVTINCGDKVTFSVTATGSSLSYQWYYKKSGATAWSKWYTKQSFSATSSSTWDGMQVYCVVTDGTGNSVSSDIATITLE